MWQMAIPAAISAVSSIVGGRSASRGQQRAAGEANRILAGAESEGYADLEGYRGLGQRGLRAYGDLLNTGRFGLDEFQADPGYNFRLQEGEKSINRNALARGRYNSGATLKALTDFSGNMADQTFDNAFSRWRNENADMLQRATGAVNTGQRAVESGNQLRFNVRQGMGSNIMGGANAAAASTMNTANAIGDAANQMGNWWAGQNALSRLERMRGYGGGNYGNWRNPMYTGRSGGEE
jgi:hypothetical protein